VTQRIEPGSIVLTPAEAWLLYQAARLGEVRTRYRVGENRTYQLLTEISICAFSSPVAADGNEPRQTTASEERGMWTVNQIAQATGRAPRTIRHDIETQLLPATKTGNTWAISNRDARTYIEGRTRA
jgi:hypothetical protein